MTERNLGQRLDAIIFILRVLLAGLFVYLMISGLVKESHAATPQPTAQPTRLVVDMHCGVAGRFARCTVIGADSLVERVFVYYSVPRYEMPARTDSGPIPITERPCTPVVFYGTDPDTWSTYIAQINIRLVDGVANITGCEQKRVRQRPAE